MTMTSTFLFLLAASKSARSKRPKLYVPLKKKKKLTKKSSRIKDQHIPEIFSEIDRPNLFDKQVLRY
jgi:hypothetical protein